MNVPDSSKADRFRFSSLRTQMALGIAGFFVLAAGLYFGFVHPALRRNVVEMEREKIRIYADLIAFQINGELTAAQKELQAIAGLLPVRTLVRDQVARLLNRLETASPLYREFILIDSNGISIGHSSPSRQIGEAHATNEYFRVAFHRGQTIVSEVTAGPKGEVTFVAGTPVTDDTGTNVLAVLAGNLALRDLRREPYGTVFPPGTPDRWRVYLIGRNGTVLAQSHPDEAGRLTGLDPKPGLAAQAAVTNLKVRAVTDEAGVRWQVGSARVGNFGWMVLVQMPDALIAQAVTSATRPVAGAFMASLCGLVALCTVAARRFIRPLETLTEALNRFSREGRAEEIAPSGSGEIAGAITAFNRAVRERRESDEALRNSEARFRRVFESEMVGILFWDRAGNITQANRVFLDLTGYTQEDVRSGAVQWREMTPPEYVERDNHALEEIAASGACTPFEKEYLCKNGRRVSVVIAAATFVVGGDNGVCFVLDVSERRRAEETREGLRRLAGELTASITVQELGGILARECRRLFAYDAFFFDLVDEPAGEHTTVVAEDTPPGADEPVALDSPAQQFSGPVRPIFRGEPILLNRPEDPVHSDLRTWGFETRRSRSLMFTPIRWEGRCIGVISVQSYRYHKFGRRDLEVLQLIADQCGPALARVRSETALRQSRQFVHQIAELMPNVLYVFDLDLGHNIFINREVGLALGYSQQEVESYGTGFVPHVMHPEDRIRFTMHLERVKQLPDGAVAGFEYRMLHKAGHWSWFHSREAVFARNMEGGVRQIIGTATDITERKEAEEEIRALNENLEDRVRERTAQLEAAVKELEAFSYSVSHDLRAPLRHVSGFAGILRELPLLANDTGARRLTVTIGDAAKRMGQLIDDLLVFSRMGRTEMRTGRVPLGELVLQVREELRPGLGTRDVQWHIGPLPEVTGDFAMLRLVFQNLVENAIKYTQRRPTARIEISSRDEADCVVVWVRDNGVGFDMQYAGQLFGVFHRLHRDEEFEGTGIGLANVRRIITRHGGKTWAEGRLDEGAVFYFSLPRADLQS